MVVGGGGGGVGGGGRAGLKPFGQIASNWIPRQSVIYSRLVKYIQVQTLVQVDWESGSTEIVPNWGPAPPLEGRCRRPRKYFGARLKTL